MVPCADKEWNAARPGIPVFRPGTRPETSGQSGPGNVRQWEAEARASLPGRKPPDASPVRARPAGPRVRAAHVAYRGGERAGDRRRAGDAGHQVLPAPE